MKAVLTFSEDQIKVVVPWSTIAGFIVAVAGTKLALNVGTRLLLTPLRSATDKLKTRQDQRRTNSTERV